MSSSVTTHSTNRSDAAGGLRRSKLAPVLVPIYRHLRCNYYRSLGAVILALVTRLEGGPWISATVRHILKVFHGVEVAMYSYGECMVPGAFPRGTRVGRYVSIAPGVKAYSTNHPTDWISTHPVLYNPSLGLVKDRGLPPSAPLVIEHDVWIGHGAIITPRCHRIGLGAIVGAGAVVTKDVPDFAIVAGNPARVLRYRFPDDVQALVRSSRWWELSLDELSRYMPDIATAIGDEPKRHPLLAGHLPVGDERRC